MPTRIVLREPPPPAVPPSQPQSRLQSQQRDANAPTDDPPGNSGGGGGGGGGGAPMGPSSPAPRFGLTRAAGRSFRSGGSNLDQAQDHHQQQGDQPTAASTRTKQHDLHLRQTFSLNGHLRLSRRDIVASPRLVGYMFNFIASLICLVSAVMFERRSLPDRRGGGRPRGTTGQGGHKILENNGGRSRWRRQLDFGLDDGASETVGATRQEEQQQLQRQRRRQWRQYSKEAGGTIAQAMLYEVAILGGPGPTLWYDPYGIRDLQEQVEQQEYQKEAEQRPRRQQEEEEEALRNETDGSGGSITLTDEANGEEGIDQELVDTNEEEASNSNPAEEEAGIGLNMTDATEGNTNNATEDDGGLPLDEQSANSSSNMSATDGGNATKDVGNASTTNGTTPNGTTGSIDPITIALDFTDRPSVQLSDAPSVEVSPGPSMVPTSVPTMESTISAEPSVSGAPTQTAAPSDTICPPMDDIMNASLHGANGTAGLNYSATNMTLPPHCYPTLSPATLKSIAPSAQPTVSASPTPKPTTSGGLGCTTDCGGTVPVSAVSYWKMKAAIILPAVGCVIALCIIAAHFDKRFAPEFWRETFKDGSPREHVIIWCLVAFWIAGLYACTSVNSVGYVQANVYFSCWAAFLTAIMNLKLWREGADMGSLLEMLAGHTRKTTYNWFWFWIFSLISLFSLLDLYVEMVEPKSLLGHSLKQMSDVSWNRVWILTSVTTFLCMAVPATNHALTRPHTDRWNYLRVIRIAFRTVEGIVLLVLTGVWFFIILKFTGVGAINSINNAYFGIYGTFFACILTFGSWLRDKKNVAWIEESRLMASLAHHQSMMVGRGSKRNLPSGTSNINQ